MSGKYDALFTPFKIGKTEIKNRLVLTAMGGTSLIEDGKFHESTRDYYIERAKGGIGLIVPGVATIQEMYGRGQRLNDSPEVFRGPIKDFMKEIHSYGTKLFIQIGAGMGRVLAINSGWAANSKDANIDSVFVGPSEAPAFWDPSKKVREMTVEEIHQIRDAIIETALLAKEADIDGIEIHAIHEGYLLDQFAIGATNHRNDEYGGSLENRMRFVCEIIRGIKKACGEDFPVMVRYSVSSKMKAFNQGALPGEDYKEFGRSLEESPSIARMLEEAGCDALDADNGSYDAWYRAHPPMYMPMACNLPEVSYLKNFVNIPVICAGRMEDPDISVKAIESGQIDGVGLARQLLADPQYPNKVKEGKIEDIRPCIACHNGCFARLFAGLGTSCAVNPQAMQEKKYAITPAKDKKRVLVVGGGIGGMETARVLTLRGHEVSLYEKTGDLGGVFIAAAAPDFKEADKKLIARYKKEMKDLNIDIHLNTEVNEKILNDPQYDEVVLATGASPRRIPVKGADGENVVEAIDCLLEKKPIGERVVVVGGGLTGCEIAYNLAKSGKEVRIVEMLDDILQVKMLCEANSLMLRDLLNYYKVDCFTSSSLKEVREGEVLVERRGEEITLPADTVVMATGYIPRDDLKESLKEGQVNLVGDCASVGNLMNVIWKAYDVALSI